MTKFWALIAAKRPHIFSLGKMENEEEALAKAEGFCARKNEENAKIVEEKNLDKETFAEYVCLALLDETDMRNLTGEVHRPFVIASPKPTVAVEGPKIHGADGPPGDYTPRFDDSADND